MVAKVPSIPTTVLNLRKTNHNNQAPAINKTTGQPIQNVNAPSQPDNAASPRQRF